MPHKKSHKSKPKSKSKRPSVGSLPMFNANQRKQLEAMGYIEKPKKKKK